MAKSKLKDKAASVAKGAKKQSEKRKPLKIKKPRTVGGGFLSGGGGSLTGG